MRRLVLLVALALGTVLFVTGSSAAQGIRGGGSVPVVRFHYENGELLQFIYPSRYSGAGSALAQDAAWTRDEAEDLERWWERQGPVFLERVADLSGLDWPYRDIDVYLVRFWPTISIQHPLVLALDAVLNESGELEAADDEDLRTLLLAHQVTHYLLRAGGDLGTRAALRGDLDRTVGAVQSQPRFRDRRAAAALAADPAEHVA